MKFSRVLFSSVAVLFLATACQGGDDELKRALESLVENDLAIMVLPQEELPDEFADLPVDKDSGFVDNEKTADDTVDPDDTAADLERAGRIIGYDLDYSDPTFSAFEAGEGVILVGTGVQLFDDGDAASDFISKQVEDFERFEGKEIEVGAVLEDVERVAVDGLGDEAIGLRIRIGFGDLRSYQTAVPFRLDRLVGAAFLTRADDENIDSQVEEIARALEQRIEGVLLGEITGTPVPIPREEEEATIPRPEGVPDLEAMALTLDDLPSGVSIDREGYVEHEDTVASYDREFDPRLARIGTSRFASLESEIDLYPSTHDARLAVVGFRSFLTDESAADIFASDFAEGAGFEATNVRFEPVPLPKIGDESVGGQISFDTPFGPFDTVLIAVRVERVVGLLSAGGLESAVDITDAVPLAEAMTQRIVAVLEAAGLLGGDESDRSLVPELVDSVLQVGTEIAFPPFEFYRVGTEIEDGLDIDLAKAIARQLGVRVDFIDTGFAGIIPALQRADFDIIITAITITPERMDVIDFVAYITVGSGILVPAGNPNNIKTLDDLCGLTVAAQVGTIQVDLLEAQNERCAEPINIGAFDTNPLAVEDLRSGGSDASFSDFPIASEDAAQSTDLEVVNTQIVPVLYGIGVRKDSTALYDAVAQAVQAIRDSGEYDQILANWGLEAVALP